MSEAKISRRAIIGAGLRLAPFAIPGALVIYRLATQPKITSNPDKPQQLSTNWTESIHLVLLEGEVTDRLNGPTALRFPYMQGHLNKTKRMIAMEGESSQLLLSHTEGDEASKRAGVYSQTTQIQGIMRESGQQPLYMSVELIYNVPYSPRSYRPAIGLVAVLNNDQMKGWQEGRLPQDNIDPVAPVSFDHIQSLRSALKGSKFSETQTAIFFEKMRLQPPSQPTEKPITPAPAPKLPSLTVPDGSII